MASNTDITSHINWLKSTGLSGEALNKKIYEDAQSYGVGADQLATAMGTSAGEINNWISSNGKSALTSSTASINSGSSSTTGNGLLQTTTSPTKASTSKKSSPTTNSGLLQSAGQLSNTLSNTSQSTGSTTNTTSPPSISNIQEHVNWLQTDQGLSGKALQNQMYIDAQRYGATASQIDQAMGWGSGTTNDWINSNGLSNLAANTTASSSTSESLDPNNITAAQIKEHIDWLQNTQGLSGAALQEKILQDAANYGLTSDRLEAVMGWDSGTVAGWSNEQGLPLLQDNRYQDTAGESGTGWQTSPYVDPLTSQVTSDQTVSGQLDSLLSQDSPLMQRAKYQGIATANSRGLLNSSLAAGAAQAAMIDAALPIAQQDAQTYYEQSRANQNVTNDFKASNLNYLQGAEQSALDRAFDQTQTEYQTNAELAKSMAETRLTQSSGLYAQFIQGMADINSSDMDQSAKDVALRSLWETISKGTELSTSLANVTFADGQLVYGGSANDVGSIVTAPETRSSDQPSIYWGDGGYYAANITRNSAEQIVDKEGNVNPDQDNTNNYYLTTDGEWKKTVIRNVYKD